MDLSTRAEAEGSQYRDQTPVRAYQRLSPAASGGPASRRSRSRKKKGLVGDFRNAGRELRPKGPPEEVRVHDFTIAANGKAVLYGRLRHYRQRGWINGNDIAATFA
jgi:hypothetical protein